MTHILGISGSLRHSSWNTGLLRAAANVLPAGAALEIFDLAPLPFFNQDLEADPPPAVVSLRERIKVADAILIASPEYNYSYTAALKNALDWASRPYGKSVLNGKPAAIMGAGGYFGTVRAQLHLRQVTTALSLRVLSHPELLIAGMGKFDAAGDLTDEATREQLRTLVAALVDRANQ